MRGEAGRFMNPAVDFIVHGVGFGFGFRELLVLGVGVCLVFGVVCCCSERAGGCFSYQQCDEAARWLRERDEKDLKFKLIQILQSPL